MLTNPRRTEGARMQIAYTQERKPKKSYPACKRTPINEGNFMQARVHDTLSLLSCMHA